MPQYRSVRIGGEVVYPTHTVPIPRGALPKQFTNELGTMIQRLAADAPPKRIPIALKCRFCDITSIDCPDRLGDDYEPQGGTTDDF